MHIQRARTLNDPLHPHLLRFDYEDRRPQEPRIKQASLKHVLKATVRGSGQGPHARLTSRLTSTKKTTASAHGAHDHHPTSRAGRAPQDRFHIPAGGEAAITTNLNLCRSDGTDVGWIDLPPPDVKRTIP